MYNSKKRKVLLMIFLKVSSEILIKEKEKKIFIAKKINEILLNLTIIFKRKYSILCPS